MNRAKKPSESAPDLSLIASHLWAYARTRALHAGVELGLFDVLADGPKASSAVASAVKAKERGVRMLCDALCALELLTKSKRGYDLTETARVFLVSGSPAYMGPMILLSNLHVQAWEKLADVVRTGKPAQQVDVESSAREFFPKLVSAIFAPSFGASTMARALLGPKTANSIVDVLDVAGGSGAWSLPWAIANPAVRVTLLDFEEVFPVAREYASKFGVADRVSCRPGNLRKVAFGREAFDLVILGHICHSEGAKWSGKLIQKAATALRPGGILLIGEFIPNDERTGPINQMLFGLNMLLNTGDGDVFTMPEYRGWMRDAGLTRIRKLDFGDRGPDIVVGVKPK
ncbi:MAG: class I SAM-dependent methyltransferase [Acidobacteria bacterium]|nr:class I SAM-dependent methyltransferase [Acidobacteriota bacterium]